MKPKAITFFDLDGTLLDKKSKITPEVAQAMKDLKANNVLPVIATGRTNIEIQEIAKDAGITSFITMNGQYVEIGGQEVYKGEIDKEIITRLLKDTKERNHPLGYYNNENIRISFKNDVAQKAYEFIHSEFPEIDEDFYLTNPVYMLLILTTSGDEFYLENYPELKFFRNGPDSIDTIAAGGSKGFGVKKLLENMGYEDVPTYGFGDGPNDMELLEACDYKIAMGNAKESLKEIATFVTKKNTEGGIVHALKHYGLLD